MKFAKVAAVQVGPALYFIEVDYGRLGRAFIECDRNKNSRRQVIENIASGDIENVVRVLEVIEDEGTCRDVTEDIAREVLDLKLNDDFGRMSRGVAGFIEKQIGCDEFAEAVRPYARAS